MRTSLPDRPGALAALAQTCAESGVDIVGVQVFPGIEAVTDEIVMNTPEEWTEERLEALVTEAGWTYVASLPCTEAALMDQVTRYVQAARGILARPAAFPEVVAQLFDAESDPAPGEGPLQDAIEMSVGDVQVQVRRTAPFTDIERARASALADLVADVLQRQHESSAIAASGTGRRLGAGVVPDYVTDGDTVTVVVGTIVVGLATVEPPLDDDPATRPVTLRVDPAWQRRGFGTRLLLEGCRLAASRGAEEILLTTHAGNQAVLPMVLAAGLRGRIRMAADQLTVRVPVRELAAGRR